MSTDAPKEATARQLYFNVEKDLLDAIDMATFMAHALEAMPDLDAVEDLPGAARIVMAIRDRMQAVKDAFAQAGEVPA